METTEAELKDGRNTIILSTRGENENEVPEEMVKFLKFIKADVSACMEDFEDEYVAQLQRSMQKIKIDREMEGRYMRLELLLHDERRKAKAQGKAEGIIEGKAEGIIEGKAEERAMAIIDILEERWEVPKIVREKILKETDMKVLQEWFRQAMKSSELEEFEEKMKEM